MNESLLLEPLKQTINSNNKNHLNLHLLPKDFRIVVVVVVGVVVVVVVVVAEFPI